MRTQIDTLFAGGLARLQLPGYPVPDAGAMLVNYTLNRRQTFNEMFEAGVRAPIEVPGPTTWELRCDRVLLIPAVAAWLENDYGGRSFELWPTTGPARDRVEARGVGLRPVSMVSDLLLSSGLQCWERVTMRIRALDRVAEAAAEVPQALVGPRALRLRRTH